jgi:hypothetical protein
VIAVLGYKIADVGEIERILGAGFLIVNDANS